MIKMIKKFLCYIGWHCFGNYELVHTNPDDKYGIANRYMCRWCSKEGLVDSQGNLF